MCEVFCLFVCSFVDSCNSYVPCDSVVPLSMGCIAQFPGTNPDYESARSYALKYQLNSIPTELALVFLQRSWAVSLADMLPPSLTVHLTPEEKKQVGRAHVSCVSIGWTTSETPVYRDSSFPSPSTSWVSCFPMKNPFLFQPPSSLHTPSQTAQHTNSPGQWILPQ